jgi:hypothetical protein
LIGVWTPEGTPSFEKEAVMQAAFLHAEAVRLVPAENKELTSLLMSYADKISPIPKQDPSGKSAAQSSASPPRVMLRCFEVPSYTAFETEKASKSGNTNADSPDVSIAPVDVSQRNPSGAEKVLMANGIRFPKGSRAEFDAGTHTLIVINTLEALDQIEALVDETGCGGMQDVTATLHIVETDGATLRKLSRDCAKEADHSEAWNRISDLVAKGSAKILRTVHLRTRTGQQATSEAGVERMSVGDFHHGRLRSENDPAASTTSSGASSTSEPGKLAATPTPLAQASDPGVSSLEYETRMAGTRLIFDPVIGPDSWTVDANLELEYHYAAPTIRSPSHAPEGQTKHVDLTATDFHCANIKTAITLSSGMTKMIGLWKPEGAEEFDGKDVAQAAFLRVDIPRN